MSIANEPATKTETLSEIQALDRSEMSVSETDKLEMSAFEERPAKPTAVDVSADAVGLPAEQSSDVHSTDLQSSGASGARTLDLTSEATQASSIPLIELAQILDEHKMWVESGGDEGAKADLTGANLAGADLTGVNLQDAILTKAKLTSADLSMANLRGANLVHADLRNATLLGTELRGANLMGATLYGAEGLWVGRLGGTNLFDALLPESVAEFSSTNPIAEASKVARFFYFTTLAVSAICCLMILFTTDVRLLLNTSALPAYLGNALPMTGFYLGAPLVLFALYLRFHFLLLRLWGSIAALPAVFPDGQTPERDGPWFLMGLIRKHFRWLRDGRSPLAVLETANLHGAGLLGSARDVAAFLGALPGAPGFSRNAAASPVDHGFSGGRHRLAGYCVPRVAIGRDSHRKIKDFLSTGAVDHARGADHRRCFAGYFAGGNSGIAGGSRHCF